MKFIFLSLSILFSLTSCYRVYYAPNTPHPALLTQKDEGRINAIYSYGAGSELNALDVQFAYAIKDHFGIMANSFFAGRNNFKDGYPAEKGNGGYLEMGGGYFNYLKNSRHWMAEVYSGIGAGWVNNYYSDYEYSRTGIIKFFAQPSIGYKESNFELAFTPRFSVVNWRVTKASFTGSNYPNDLDLISIVPTFFAFEPAMMIRFGTKDVKAQLGLTVSNPGKIRSYLTESLMLNAGLSFSFHQRRTGK
jgi:hypothetical protein